MLRKLSSEELIRNAVLLSLTKPIGTVRGSRSSEEGDDGDSGLAQWSAERVYDQMNQ